jgi:DNA-binding GntR family transcriptional regulator
MAPRAGVDRGIAGLHEPHQRHLPLVLGHSLPFRAGATVLCNISHIKLIATTVRAQAASELRDRILTGRLQPGDRLDLDQLTAEFGISRTPIREALLELSYEGLVEITPRSGMAVVGITPEDAVDNFAILAALAGKAAEMATGRMTPTELAELADLADAIEGSDDVVAANRSFHRALNLAARSPRLLTYLRQAVRVVPGNYFELFPEAEQHRKQEHAALLEAMTRGDASGARGIAEAHVLSAGEALGGWLAARAAQHRAAAAPA